MKIFTDIVEVSDWNIWKVWKREVVVEWFFRFSEIKKARLREITRVFWCAVLSKRKFCKKSLLNTQEERFVYHWWELRQTANISQVTEHKKHLFSNLICEHPIAAAFQRCDILWYSWWNVWRGIVEKSGSIEITFVFQFSNWTTLLWCKWATEKESHLRWAWKFWKRQDRNQK